MGTTIKKHSVSNSGENAVDAALLVEFRRAAFRVPDRDIVCIMGTDAIYNQAAELAVGEGIKVLRFCGGGALEWNPESGEGFYCALNFDGGPEDWDEAVKAAQLKYRQEWDFAHEGEMTGLIGLDVGFSGERPSSGVARLCASGDVLVGHCGVTLGERIAVVGNSPAQLVAIDAPIAAIRPDEYRNCEKMMVRGMFAKRCKPGCSHVRGTGQQFRKAGANAEQMRSLAADLAVKFPRMVASCNIMEAFPNKWEFLGVALAGDVYENAPRLKRGKKFDWLYDKWVERDLFSSLARELRIKKRDEFLKQCGENNQHDQRAALSVRVDRRLCVRRTVHAVGDERGGYFFLPPWKVGAGGNSATPRACGHMD